MRVCAAPDESFSWLADRTGVVLTKEARGLVAVDASGRIRGMLAFDCWTPNSCWAHMAVDAPIAWRRLVLPGFEYVFRQAGRGLLLGAIASANEKSLQMAKALGFSESHRIRDGYSEGVDLVVVEMRREACPWLREERKAA